MKQYLVVDNAEWNREYSIPHCVNEVFYHGLCRNMWQDLYEKILTNNNNNNNNNNNINKEYIDLYNKIETINMVYGSCEFELANNIKNISPYAHNLEIISIEIIDLVDRESIHEKSKSESIVTKENNSYGIDICYLGSSLICNSIFESSVIDKNLFDMLNEFGLLKSYWDAIKFIRYCLDDNEIFSNWIDGIFNHFEIIYINKEVNR